MGLLDGKKALIAGVANKDSIAWGMARALRAQGAEIAFTCLKSNVRRLKKLAPEVESDLIFPCDVRSDEEIARAFDCLKEAFDGELHILVHSIAYADIDDLGGEFVRTTRSGWNLAMEVSAYSLVVLTRKARPLMKAAGGGSIITLSFEGGERVVPGYNIMGVAKAALNMSVRYLAYDLGPENIRVNAISAGPIRTISSMVIDNFDNALHRTRVHSPLLRNITEEDMGKTAVYLASDLSSGVTGAVLMVDSGMNVVCSGVPPHRKSSKNPQMKTKSTDCTDYTDG